MKPSVCVRTAITLTLAACLAIAVALLGCDGSSNSDAGVEYCGKVAPCGGDIRGTWRVVGSCSPIASPLGVNSLCPGQATDSASVSISGTATFSSNGTYTIYLTQSVSGTIVVPTSCLQSHGITVTCDEISTALGGTSQDGAAASATMGACIATGTSCECAFVMSGAGSYEMGTYSVSDSTLSTTSRGSANRADYCVDGNTLRVLSPAGMGITTLLSTTGIVATRE